MRSKKTNRHLKTWSQLKVDRFKKDSDEAIEYLKTSLIENGDKPALVIEAIRTVSEALEIPIEQIAKKSGKAPSTIHKALSKDGNPSLDTLTAILKTLGLRLSVERAG